VLLDSLVDLLEFNSVVLLTSPAGAGKTSLLTLLRARYHSIYVHCAPPAKDKVYNVLMEAGIDMHEKKWTNDHVVILIDDAQNTYGDTDGWTWFLKGGSQ
jgi:predicted AAA+ superfamily ATPase